MTRRHRIQSLRLLGILLRVQRDWIAVRTAASLPATWLVASATVLHFYAAGLIFNTKGVGFDSFVSFNIPELAVPMMGAAYAALGVATWAVAPHSKSPLFFVLAFLNVAAWCMPLTFYTATYGVSTALTYGGLALLPLAGIYRAVQIRYMDARFVPPTRDKE